MTDKAISPLRQRLIEDMTIRPGSAPRPITSISATSKASRISSAARPRRPPRRTSVAISCGWHRSEPQCRPSTPVPLHCASSSGSR